MDCAFLLAEEYESRNDFRRAYALLSAIVRFEKQKPYFRHFMLDVYERVRSIVCFQMTETEAPDRVLDCIHEMLEWDLPKKDIAFCYKKAAELYLERGERREAFRYLQRGLKLDNRLAGVKKLQQQLGYFETA